MGWATVEHCKVRQVRVWSENGRLSESVTHHGIRVTIQLFLSFQNCRSAHRIKQQNIDGTKHLCVKVTQGLCTVTTLWEVETHALCIVIG